MDRKGSGMRTRLPGRALLVTALALVARSWPRLQSGIRCRRELGPSDHQIKKEPGVNERSAIASTGGQLVRQYSLIPAILAEVPADSIKKLQSDPLVSYVEEEQHRVPTGHIIPGQIWAGCCPRSFPGASIASTPTKCGTRTMISPSMVEQSLVWASRSRFSTRGYRRTTPTSLRISISPTASTSSATTRIRVTSQARSRVTALPPRHRRGSRQQHRRDRNRAQVQSNHVSGVRLRLKRLCHWPSCLCARRGSGGRGADVVSMSYGGIGFSQAEKHAIKPAADAGLVLVASAGNTPSPVAGARHYPSGYPEVISVGATGKTTTSPTSRRSEDIRDDLVAPGVETPTTTLLGLRKKRCCFGGIQAPRQHFSTPTR